ncbi:Rieske (2Fe-2S) protein (plasmid) [Ralstonia sp. 25C]|uniref:Rieske (2Fe-2S) protein n=1 Tax=Ralstonia sp. 25C TaxID=3447363 RepID=UPI003F75685A
MPNTASIPMAELSPGLRKLVFIDGRGMVLFNIEGTVYAIDNSCPHQGASLAGGKLDGTRLQCPAHGLRFDLATGCAHGGAGLCLSTYGVEVIDGRIAVHVDDGP